YTGTFTPSTTAFTADSNTKLLIHSDFDGGLGADSSGNTNDFTPTNLVATDQVLDSPTNNYCTFNPLDSNPSMLLSNGNLYSSGVTLFWEKVRGTFGVSSGKYYWELNLVSTSYAIFGVADSTMDILGTASAASGAWAYSTYGTLYSNGAGGVPYGDTCTTGDIIGVALDMDGGNIEFFKNNSSQGVLSLGLSGNIMPYCSLYTSDLVANFGQDSSFAGAVTAQGNQDGNGKGDFYYAPPSGYLALCTDNLPDPEIKLPGDNFNTVLYTGTGSIQTISGVGFQSDFTWIKSRSDSDQQNAFDILRTNGILVPNTTAVEGNTGGGWLRSWNSDGFSVDVNGPINTNNSTYVAWNWKAGGSHASLSANATAGFSIAKNTGTGAQCATNHGLGVTPNLVIWKNLDDTSHWFVWSDTFSNATSHFLFLEDNVATVTSGYGSVVGTI
ncbi:MAG: SPRY domain-containing protein, partial [Anaerolineales bacterium]|nr:SPRY domain-containing protein [Anaerolineales bacterium]